MNTKAQQSASPSARLAAARILAAWIKTGVFPDRLLEAAPGQRALTTELTYGVIRNFRRLEWILARLASRPPRAELAALIFVGLQQVLFMEHMAEHAAVFETVAAARSLGGRGAVALVNALLRRAQRERAALLESLSACSPGVRLSHPDLLLERWSACYGADQTERLCEWNNEIPDTILRVNRLRTDGGALQGLLRGAGIAASPHPADPERFLRLPHGHPIADLPGYAEGFFAVQDPATALAVDLLQAQPGEAILDACAAPGGKTGLLAEALQGKGMVIALDSVPPRLRRLRENIERLRAAPVRVFEGRADDPATALRHAKDFTRGGFDAILLDAPCTNTGVIRRRPDARWRFSLPRLREACRLQAALLDGVCGALRPGGRLVYSTCSLEPEENQEQVRAWLGRHPELSLRDEPSLFPPDSDTDGAYAALLIRDEHAT